VNGEAVLVTVEFEPRGGLSYVSGTRERRTA